MKKLKIMAIILIGLLLSGCEEEKHNTLTGQYKVEINIQDYGVIKATLEADKAPITVKNFLKLVDEKFYDGLTFHRIIKDFMIQGGDPNGDGSGGSKNTIEGEFLNNGIQNNISHKRGVLSMARNGYDYNSASSQFFIVHKDSPYLDGDYAAFGYVTEGMDIVDKICNDVKVEDDNGLVLRENQPIITSITREKTENKKDNDNSK